MFCLEALSRTPNGPGPDLKIAVKMISFKFIASMFDIFKLLCDVPYLVGSQGTIRTQLHSVCLVSFKLNLSGQDLIKFTMGTNFINVSLSHFSSCFLTVAVVWRVRSAL